VATARELGDLDGELPARVQHSFLAWIAGDAEECLVHARTAVELAERRGAASINAVGRIGMAHLLASRFEEAAASLSEAVVITREKGFFVNLALHLALLADAQLGGGLGTEARASAEEALEIARHRGRRCDECLARLALARALRATEGVAARGAIESQLDAAASIVEETGIAVYAPFVVEERARLARVLGDEALFERSLREAQRLFAEMGAAPRAERLAHELA
jgi:hypothetical protein